MCSGKELPIKGLLDALREGSVDQSYLECESSTNVFGFSRDGQFIRFHKKL